MYGEQIARLLAAKGELSAAEAECRRALRLAPEHLEAHVLLANCLDDHHRTGQAEVLYRNGNPFGARPGWKSSIFTIKAHGGICHHTPP